MRPPLLRHVRPVAALAAVLLAAQSMAVAAPARAQEPGEPAAPADARAPQALLQEARAAIYRARYEEAIAAARAVLDHPEAAAAERNRALELLATAKLALRDEPGAFSVLWELYRRDPGHRLSDPDASPLVQSAFARARRERPAPLVVSLRLDAPPAEAGSGGEAPLLQVRVLDHRDAVHEVRVAYRTPEMDRYGRLVLPLGRDDVARGRLPTGRDERGRSRVEFFVEAVAPSGAVLGRIGSAEAPRRWEGSAGPAASGGGERPSPERPRPLAPAPAAEAPREGGSWWPWAVAGGLVVVGGAVAAALLLGGPEEPAGTLGTVALQ